MTTFATAMRIDHEHDAAISVGDHTCYESALREHAGLFRDDSGPTCDPARFAWAAWQIARPPVTEPGYVQLHDRVVQAVQTTEDALRVSIHIAMPLPTQLQLAALAAGDATTWCRSDDGALVDPPMDLHTTDVLPSMVIRVGVMPQQLPVPTYIDDQPERATAIEALEALCDCVNLRVGPILDELTGRRQRW